MKNIILIATICSLVLIYGCYNSADRQERSDTKSEVVSLDKNQELKNDSIAQEKRKRDSAFVHDSTIRIVKCYPSAPNSAGGVDANIVFTNKSKKEIKYVFFTIAAYNGVDDKVECEIRRSSEARVKVTGPIKPNETSGWGRYWECVFYNHSIKYIKIEEVEIEYMDKTKFTISKKDIPKIK